MAVLYDQDFYQWTQETAALVRAAKFDCLDLGHLAEEIEDMGNRDKNEQDTSGRFLGAYTLSFFLRS